ncbi:hypothetical protein BJF79_04495 [Actinomadura sp. CNU-125]|uniref:hypothetical protein n=1 Tax=Actinomadura sp. CNU-125 TaxID=1904961 RepID=UPI00095E141B|nr:hypothetical protein [Actinomadura sp. CNU-125]OLT11157.1 hypothetical protein BJF79_04495 [Actinomadura sp. CNU-125]
MAVSTAAPAGMPERVRDLRTALTDDPAGRGLIDELLPRDVAATGRETVVDWSDWTQWNQWPQSY